MLCGVPCDSATFRSGFSTSRMPVQNQLWEEATRCQLPRLVATGVVVLVLMLQVVAPSAHAHVHMLAAAPLWTLLLFALACGTAKTHVPPQVLSSAVLCCAVLCFGFAVLCCVALHHHHRQLSLTNTAYCQC